MLLARPENKYIVGWLKLREGMEAEYDRLSQPYIATCRAEPECRFFEMLRTREDPLTVLVCECFTSEEAHSAHLEEPHFHAFWQDLHRMALEGHFENVIAGVINCDAYDFSTGQPI